MGKYNFDKVINREGSSCVKYDLRETIFANSTVLPMWVADMDFATPDFIIKTLEKRCSHPILGYTLRDKAFSDAIVWWNEHRHSWKIKHEQISFCAGVVSGLNHAIQAFTNVGDSIIIQPPVYHPFFSTVENNGRKLVFNPLVKENNNYLFDYNNLEELAAKGAKMLILSNPHNPVGRVWNKEELIRIGEICLKYNVLVVADEIHSDLILKPHKHIPFASLNEQFSQNSITFASTSKTFNLAGLFTGYAIITNPEYLKKYNHTLEMTGAGMGNIFGFEAVKAAYSPEGEKWLEELLTYIDGNMQLVKSFLKLNLPKIELSDLQGTYLLWLNFNSYQMDDDRINDLLINKAEVGLNKGSVFGVQGKGFQRMNIACPRSSVEYALDRIHKVFKTL